MDKKELYEHLAKIYLDASSKKKKKHRAYPIIFRNLFFVSVMLIVGLSFALLFTAFKKNSPFSSDLSLALLTDAAKINFHFDPARRETYSINLNNLNLGRYKSLAFSVRKVNVKDNISLRVEFVSAYKEKSAVYFKNIPTKWGEYKVKFSEFKDISDWSQMRNLAFIIEEWNVKEKHGVVYIDNVRLEK